MSDKAPEDQSVEVSDIDSLASGRLSSYGHRTTTSISNYVSFNPSVSPSSSNINEGRSSNESEQRELHISTPKIHKNKDKSVKPDSLPFPGNEMSETSGERNQDVRFSSKTNDRNYNEGGSSKTSNSVQTEAKVKQNNNTGHLSTSIDNSHDEKCMSDNTTTVQIHSASMKTETATNGAYDDKTPEVEVSSRDTVTDKTESRMTQVSYGNSLDEGGNIKELYKKNEQSKVSDKNNTFAYLSFNNNVTEGHRDDLSESSLSDEKGLSDSYKSQDSLSNSLPRQDWEEKVILTPQSSKLSNSDNNEDGMESGSVGDKQTTLVGKKSQNLRADKIDILQQDPNIPEESTNRIKNKNVENKNSKITPNENKLFGEHSPSTRSKISAEKHTAGTDNMQNDNKDFHDYRLSSEYEMNDIGQNESKCESHGERKVSNDCQKSNGSVLLNGSKISLYKQENNGALSPNGSGTSVETQRNNGALSRSGSQSSLNKQRNDGVLSPNGSRLLLDKKKNNGTLSPNGRRTSLGKNRNNGALSPSGNGTSTDKQRNNGALSPSGSGTPLDKQRNNGALSPSGSGTSLDKQRNNGALSPSGSGTSLDKQRNNGALSPSGNGTSLDKQRNNGALSPRGSGTPLLDKQRNNGDLSESGSRTSFDKGRKTGEASTSCESRESPERLDGSKSKLQQDITTDRNQTDDFTRKSPSDREVPPDVLNESKFTTLNQDESFDLRDCSSPNCNKSMVPKRKLLRSRKRKRIYSTDMFVSDGDMSREAYMTRPESAKSNELLQRAGSNGKLSDIVATEVFRVRRMSMPVQCHATKFYSQEPHELENTKTTEIKRNVSVSKSSPSVSKSTQCVPKISLPLSKSSPEKDQRDIESIVRKDEECQSRKDTETENNKPSQSIYDIYLELTRLRNKVAGSVGSKVRDEIEKRLTDLHEQTTAEDDNKWRKIQRNIHKLRVKLQKQQESEEIEQDKIFIQQIISDILSTIVPKNDSSSDENDDQEKQKQCEDNDDDQNERNIVDKQNMAELNGETTINDDFIKDATAVKEENENQETENCDDGEDMIKNKEDNDIDNYDAEDTKLNGNDELKNANDENAEKSPDSDSNNEGREYETEVADSGNERSSERSSEPKGIKHEDKVTFSLDQNEEIQISRTGENGELSISRTGSATSSPLGTPKSENALDFKYIYDQESCGLERDSDWSGDSVTEDTFIPDLESPSDNLNLHVFRVKNDLDEEVVSCIIQTHDGISETLESSFINPLELPSAVDEYENVLSYFVKLASPDIGQLLSEEITTVAIPYDREEITYYQEPILRALAEKGNWTDVDFVDRLYDDGNMSISVLETELRELTVWVVVARPIIDHLHFDDKLNEAVSTTDSDICISVPPGSRYNPLDMRIELKVIPVINEVLEEAKIAANDDMNVLFGASSLVSIELNEDPSQPIYIYLPCNKPYTRPQTGSRSSSRRSASRRSATLRLGTADSGYRSTSRVSSGKLSSCGLMETRQETENHLVRCGGGMPLKHKMIKQKEIDKHGKIMCTVLEKSCTCLVIEGRKYSKTPDMDKAVTCITNVLRFQKVHICVIQPKSNVNNIKAVCTLKSHINSVRFNSLEQCHNLSQGHFRLNEGDVIRLCFRGNIRPIGESDKLFRFYGIHGFSTDWNIGVVDFYSQRSLEYFCGFMQIFKWTGQRLFDLQQSDAKDCRYWGFVAEISVTLPKTAPRAMSHISRAPVRIRSEGPITIEYLISLANRIGDEWPRLARALRIEHARLQSIIQQNHNNMVANLVTDILLTWLKRSPHSNDKATVLCYALKNCGRKDLSDEIQEKDRYHKMQRSTSAKGLYHKMQGSTSAKESRMENVIRTVSRCPSASTKWRPLAHRLGLSETDVRGIEHTSCDDNMKCENMLKLWKQKETEYRLKSLVSSLRGIGCKYVADHLDSTRR